MEQQTWVKYDEVDKFNGRFIIEPLNKGMGVTLGNSLRRVLLSSLDGHGIVGVEIKGITHEFSTVPNVMEDVLEIICNLKGVIFEKKTEEVVIAKINILDKKIVKAKDIQCNSGLKIINPDHYLFEVSGKANVEIDIFIESGLGYRDMNNQEHAEDRTVNYIATDTSFSPIEKVNHQVDPIRVGDSMNYDKLTLDLTTNGVLSPDDAIKKAVHILSSHLEIFSKINEKPELDNSEEKEMEDLKIQSILNMSVDELELSARSSNCLKRAGIDKVNELLQKDMSELVQIKNFGKKSADEINMRLKQFNLALKGTEEVEE